MSNFQQSHIDTAWKNHRIKLSEKRGNHSAVKIDDHSFVVSGGFDGKKLSSVDLIDIVKNSSNQPIQLPELAEGRCDHSSHFHNGYLMITGGGLNSTNRLKINTNLDKKSNWETKYIPDFQDKMRQYCTSIIDDDKLYVIGGQLYNDSKALSSIIAIDLPDDGGGKLNSSNGIVSFSSWKHIVDMKQARIEHASVKIGKKIFTMGGRIITDDSTKDIRVFDSMEIWDLSSNKISEGKKLPTTLYAAAAVAVGKFIVVTGGRSAPDVQNNNVFFYDTEKDIWNTDTSNPFKTPRYGHSAVVLHHNTIVVCGGFDASNKSVDSLECSNFSNLIRYNGTFLDSTQ
jgi:N-acetylneuraminic acid mutarotase